MKLKNKAKLVISFILLIAFAIMAYSSDGSSTTNKEEDKGTRKF